MSTKFIFEDEDHTMGHLIRARLLLNENVEFAAYRTVHPLKRTLEICVVTNGEITAEEALEQAVNEELKAVQKIRAKRL